MLQVPEKSLYYSQNQSLSISKLMNMSYTVITKTGHYLLSCHCGPGIFRHYLLQHLYAVEEETKTQDDYKVQGDMVRKQHYSHRICLLRASQMKVLLQTEQSGPCRLDGIEVDDIRDQRGS